VKWYRKLYCLVYEHRWYYYGFMKIQGEPNFVLRQCDRCRRRESNRDGKRWKKPF
jgi:hypothetical protein